MLWPEAKGSVSISPDFSTEYKPLSPQVAARGAGNAQGNGYPGTWVCLVPQCIQLNKGDTRMT
jgi:hypothetical protein